MKAVTSHAFTGEFTRDGVVCNQLAVGVMEGGIKTSDLHQIWIQFAQRHHSGDVVRLMQRCKRNQTSQLSNYRIVNDHWRGI